jgi:hypothetical protein
MGVDYSLAPVPERAYYADYCNVARSRVAITLTFGKLAGSQKKLRTKIEIVFPEAMFQKQLWGTTAPVREVIDRSVDGKVLAPLGEIDSDPEKVQTFRANNVFVAVWIEEGVLDFYYISPRDGYVLQVKDGSQIGLEPVVRVVLDMPVMKEFFDQCVQFVSEEPEPNEEPELDEDSNENPERADMEHVDDRAGRPE